MYPADLLPMVADTSAGFSGGRRGIQYQFWPAQRFLEIPNRAETLEGQLEARHLCQRVARDRGQGCIAAPRLDETTEVGRPGPQRFDATKLERARASAARTAIAATIFGDKELVFRQKDTQGATPDVGRGRLSADVNVDAISSGDVIRKEEEVFRPVPYHHWRVRQLL